MVIILYKVWLKFSLITQYTLHRLRNMCPLQITIVVLP